LSHRQHGDHRRIAREPGHEQIRVGRADQHRVIALRRYLVRVGKVGGDPRQQFRPVDGVLAAVQAELMVPLRHRGGVNGEPRGIGTALGHAHQHRHHERAELIAQSRILDQKTDDSTHGPAPKAFA